MFVWDLVSGVPKGELINQSIFDCANLLSKSRFIHNIL